MSLLPQGDFGEGIAKIEPAESGEIGEGWVGDAVNRNDVVVDGLGSILDSLAERIVVCDRPLVLRQWQATTLFR
jgi:hypothetical protein